MGHREVLTASRGSATVEFFLTLPLILLVLAAGVQVVALAQARVELQGAVREGVRVAATAPDPSRAVEAVRAALPEGLRDRTRISVSRPSVVGRPARVTARVRLALPLPLSKGLEVDLSASATMLVER
ncbi:MAG TPA: hypothetical protein EYP73_08045 [Acidimicrobiia bacterium]|nr:hypothetical protein [Acidimicrobiia bacterium]